MRAGDRRRHDGPWLVLSALGDARFCAAEGRSRRPSGWSPCFTILVKRSTTSVRAAKPCSGRDLGRSSPPDHGVGTPKRRPRFLAKARSGNGLRRGDYRASPDRLSDRAFALSASYVGRKNFGLFPRTLSPFTPPDEGRNRRWHAPCQKRGRPHSAQTPHGARRTGCGAGQAV